MALTYQSYQCGGAVILIERIKGLSRLNRPKHRLRLRKGLFNSQKLGLSNKIFRSADDRIHMRTPLAVWQRATRQAFYPVPLATAERLLCN